MPKANLAKISKAIEAGDVYSLFSEFEEHDSLPAFLEEEGEGFPPVLQASFQINKETPEWQCASAFERLNKELREREFGDRAGKPLPSINGHDLSNVIEGKIEAYERATTAGTKACVPNIHLEGLIIDGNLRLSGRTLPCSLRLINCVIRGALLLDRAKLETLDLSGTIIKCGVSAPHLKLSGALRMRRTVVTGIMDFGASEIHGPVDAQDSVCIPVHLPPNGVAWVSDRSLVNFGLSEVGKQMRLNRVRWFGGLEMRGIHVRGSLFMTDAIIRSPLAVAEKVLVENASSDGVDFPVHTNLAVKAEYDLADRIHCHADKRAQAVEAEILSSVVLPGHPGGKGGFSAGEFNRSLLARLLFESVRVHSNAIRLDGASIDGVFSAEGMRIGGRVRLKKIQVKYTLVLSGSHIRTYRAQFATMELVANTERESEAKKFATHILRKLRDADDSSPTIRNQYAVDLRRARIGNSVEFRKDVRKLNGKQGSRRGEEAPTRAEHEAIIKVIVRNLCKHTEDPSRFLQALFGRPGEINDFLDNSTASRAEDDDDFTTYKRARDGLRAIEEKLDPKAFAYLEMERKLEANPDLPENSDRRIDRQLSARVRGDLAKAEDEIVEVMCGLERLKSTLIIGEVSLAGAHIGGSLSFLGTIANVFGDIAPTREPTLNISNARIEDDLDLRDTIGFQSIAAEQAKIYGTLKMANEPKLTRVTDRYGAAGRRAMFISSPQVEAVSSDPALEQSQASKPISRYAFERAEIGGDAIFVFDHENGPALDLSFIQVKGKLAILPARGGVILTDQEVGAEAFLAEQVRKFGVIEPAHSVKAIFSRATFTLTKFFVWISASRSDELLLETDFWIHKHQKLTSEELKAQIEAEKPKIDLRNGFATVFSHPPSAWPQQDGLFVEGFRYDRTHEIGPLLAKRRTRNIANGARRTNWARVAVALTISILIAIFPFGWFGDTIATRGFGAEVVGNPRNIFGERNFIVAQCFVALCCWVLLMHSFTRPNSKDAKPLAIGYLQRQARKFNGRRTRAMVRPFASYLHAAKILRADGHLLAADRVEVERLRMRRKALSWRTAGLLRLMLKATDVTMQYGFAPVRIISIAVAIMLVGTFLTSAAKTADLAVPAQLVQSDMSGFSRFPGRPRSVDDNPSLERNYEASDVEFAGRSRGQQQDENQQIQPNPAVILNGDSGGAQPGVPPGGKTTDDPIDERLEPYLEKELISALYTIDVMIPFLDLGQESSFEFLRPKDPSSFALAEWFTSSFWLVPLGLKVIGWVLTSIIALAAAARLETVIARND